MADDKKLEKIPRIEAGKAVAMDAQAKQLREGEKPSAPANLVLPKPVKVPVASANSNKPEKK